MYRIAVVDDEENAVSTIVAHLEKFRKENLDSEFSVNTFSDGEDFLSHADEAYDILFLDVDMPKLNGLETAAKLREKDSDIAIVFITNMAQYAIDGYSVNAIDYVLKPVGYYDFSMKMKKVLNHVRRNMDKTIPVRISESNLTNLNVRNIRYVEVLLHYIVYHTIEGEIKVRGSMRETEKELTPYAFARTGKSFLVNMRWIKAVKGFDIQLKNGEILTLSRSKKDEFLEKFFAYIGNVRG